MSVKIDSDIHKQDAMEGVVRAVHHLSRLKPTKYRARVPWRQTDGQRALGGSPLAGPGGFNVGGVVSSEMCQSLT